MTTIQLEIPAIPHGHGLSFKKGLADGLLENHLHESEPHSTHCASYKRGIDVGIALKERIAMLVNA
jgi:hypothetical protein